MTTDEKPREEKAPTQRDPMVSVRVPPEMHARMMRVYERFATYGESLSAVWRRILDAGLTAMEARKR